MSRVTENTLKEVFGFDAFRPGQEAAIEALKNDKNVFLVKPTGGGKSLIYQFLAAEGHRVIVLSPLIALMEDQVFQSKGYKIASACLHSQMSSEKRKKNLRNWGEGKLNLLFVTPERFFKPEFRDNVQKMKPDFFVVDEAHCASQWGHDFRPDYSKVGEIRSFLGNPPTFCCTATATPRTRDEVLRVTGLDKEETEVLVNSVLRGNLEHEHKETLDFKDKLEEFMRLDLGKGPAIIYFSLIKTLESVAEHLDSLGLNYVKYHSKIPARFRHKNQQSFIDGEVDLMLATPAFGLGVDKENIRSLVHFELPGSIEAYVQEFGRAGRDGKPAECILLYSQEDIALQMDFIKWGHPNADTLRWVHKQIAETKELGLPENQVFDLKKKLNFYNTYDFRLESSINILLRWSCLEKRGTKYFVGPEPLKSVPDIETDLSEQLIQIQQKKLLDLIQLVRKEDQDSFDLGIQTYFGEIAFEQDTVEVAEEK